MSGRKFGTYIIPFPQNGYGMVQLKYQPKFLVSYVNFFVTYLKYGTYIVPISILVHIQYILFFTS